MPFTVLIAKSADDLSDWYSTRLPKLGRPLSSSLNTVYVILTFWTFFHMGNEECMTCHLPSMNAVGGT